MPIAWYIVPYVRDPSPPTGPWLPGLTLALNVDAPELAGTWEAIEAGAGYAVVKIKAEDKTLETLDALYKRLPSDDLKSGLDTVPADEKNGLRQTLLDMKYTEIEIDAQFPRGFDGHTLEEVVKFMASRRRLPRYDEAKDEHVFDGAEIAEDAKRVDDLDGKLNGIR